MYSVKPGRALSFGGVIGSIFGIIFGIGWTILAFTITGAANSATTPSSDFMSPGMSGVAENADQVTAICHIIFPLFGIFIILASIGNLIYNLYNATAQNRLSLLDITTNGQEPDPLNRRFNPAEYGGNRPPASPGGGASVGATSSTSGGDIEQRLAEIQALRDAGKITDAEFHEQRERILNSV